MSPSGSTIMSPRLMPMRKTIRWSSSTPALRLSVDIWILTAQETASTALANSTRAPSPVSFTMRPLWTRAYKIVGCSGCFWQCLVIGHRPEARIALPKAVLECVVQHGGAHVQEELHRRSVPAHLLRLVHALGHDLIDRALSGISCVWVGRLILF